MEKVKGGDLNVGSLTLEPWSKQHFTHGGVSAEHNGIRNSKMGKIMKPVMLRESFMEKLYLNRIFRLIMWKTAEKEMSLCMVCMGKEEGWRRLYHNRHEFSKISTLDSTESVLVQSNTYIILLLTQCSFNEYESTSYSALEG